MRVKDIFVNPVNAPTARAFVKKWHYSHKVVNNSQVHYGAYYNNVLHGIMSFGPSMDKRKIQGLVKDTGWNEFVELNRMAFDDTLPKNSESRALSVALRLLKKSNPQLKWVISFADATQCGDGTMYRAANFLLTGIKENNQVWVAPNKEVFSRLSLTDGRSYGVQNRELTIARMTMTKGKHINSDGKASMKKYIEAGFRPLKGYQLRYIYFYDKGDAEALVPSIIPYSTIVEVGASMYKGIKRGEHESNASCFLQEESGVIPTTALQNSHERELNGKKSHQE